MSDAVEKFADKMWRMNNLYMIVNEGGTVVKFRPNTMQEKFLREMWYLNVILKARQHGFTTLIDLWILDECLFYPNQSAGIIAHNLEDAGKIFRNKIKFPYDNLPEAIKASKPAKNDKAHELVFGNESTISVGTSMRSGTLQYLHVSEFGKIAAKYPEKADEVVTGSFNTVAPGSYIFVESTAEGRAGHFYDMVKRTRDFQRLGRPLSKLDFKFHFFSWFDNPAYTLDDADAQNVVFLKSHIDYFNKIENQLGIKLTLGQRAFYVKKRQINGDLQKREYPSTPDEAFEASVRGAYFAEQMAMLREKRQITKVPHEKALPVDTWWDLGMRDKTAIWFVQTLGMEVRLIDYFETSDRPLTWFLQTLLPERAKERGYFYRHHIGPHDLAVRDYARGEVRWQVAQKLGYKFMVAPQMDVEDQIEAARNVLPSVWIDEERCEVGIDHLDNFRKEWNDHLGVYMDKPVHDQHSHAASAFMTGAIMARSIRSGGVKAQPVAPRSFPT